jgi:SAM-dependent methyltransferase/uncharacterized protein YbaR (Trm112 family)
MDLTKYRCPKCHRSDWAATMTVWRCDACGQAYPCVEGIPRLCAEERVGRHDIALRNRLYDSFFGAYYRFVWPLLSLPVRPLHLSWPYWIAYGIVAGLVVALVGHLADLLLVRRLDAVTLVDAAAMLAGLCLGIFFLRHPYAFSLLVLAVPARISLLFTRFRPDLSFSDIHARCIAELLGQPRMLRVLDVSTGTCASLYRHGWMKLNAEFTGVDLSETMLRQGRDFMTAKGVPMDFALADAADLPFQAETFDVVLNYGAVNGMSDPARALAEMSRVAKDGALILFFDEQLYEGAPLVERLYFRRVLSSHNVVHRCPVDLLPADVSDVHVYQPYHFYYLCTAIKSRAAP